jgi:hypothetical protein
MQYGYREKAIAHYRLAARMGDDYAINNLRELGEPVPEPDLVRPVQQSGSASILPLLNAIISGYNGGTERGRRDRVFCDSISTGSITSTDCVIR